MGSHRATGPARSAVRRAGSRGPNLPVGFHRDSTRTRTRGLHAAPSSAEWSSHLPRAAAVGTLALALVLAPIPGAHGSGRDAGPEPLAAAPASAEVAPPPPVPGGQIPTAPAPVFDVDFRVAPSPASPTPTPAVVAAQPQALPVDQLLALRADAEQASRTQERARLDGCTGQPPATQPANGQIDPAELCTLWDGQEMLRADAAVALAALNAEYFAAHGNDICLTDSYRSYGEQVAVKRVKPGLAAQPGTSQHGWGLAIDVCGLQGYDGGVYSWLRANAPAFGWDNPEWALAGGSGPDEPWHWEYLAGQPTEPAVG